MNSVSVRRRAVWPLVHTAVVLGLGASVMAARPAHAQLAVELTVQEAPQKQADGKDKDKDKGEKGGVPPPIFRAVVIGAIPGLAAEQFTLRQDDIDVPVSIPADKVKTYVESDDPMAMVVLIQGDERWIGNESYLDAEDPDRMEGAFQGLGAALDALAKAGPPGSKTAVLIYSQGRADPKLPMGDAAQLGAGALGSQKDYQNNIGVPLLVGLDEALNLFDKHAGYRKILVTIGDGTGQEEDIAEGLKERINKLEQRKVESFSIFYESIVSGSPEGQNNMKKIGYSEAKAATSRENFEAFAKQFVEHIGARYYAIFPGCTAKKPQTCFVMDGQMHDFVLKAGEMESDVISLKTPLFQKAAPEEEGSLWWLWLLLGLLVIGLVVVILVVVARNRQPPPPEPVFVDVPPPPAPVGQKTMMINAGASDGGMPIVGWIVPLTGANQYQTFKLLHGVTKIGTGMDCHIPIQDQFMSSYHCEIICSPMGFTLKDGGSTNGTYVNDRRVSSHELVDNDMITMGKTNFKFKSIN
jgi:hypothetical protein